MVFVPTDSLTVTLISEVANFPDQCQGSSKETHLLFQVQFHVARGIGEITDISSLGTSSNDDILEGKILTYFSI